MLRSQRREFTGSSLVSAQQLGRDLLMRQRTRTGVAPLVMSTEDGLDLGFLEGLRGGMPLDSLEATQLCQRDDGGTSPPRWITS